MMVKRMEEQKEEDKIVTTSKWTAMNLTSTVSTSSSSVCVDKPGDTKSIFRETWREGKKKLQNPTQRRVLKEDWKMHTLEGWCLK